MSISMAKVLLNCPNPVGQTMSGPAIRYWELAKSLSNKHDVTLLVPNTCDLPAQKFTIIKKTAGYHHLFRGMDAVISMNMTHSSALAAKMHGAKIILDAYDPLPFEYLETNKGADMASRNKGVETITNNFNIAFKMADSVICANENQRDLWTGLMLSLRKIHPAVYDLDPALKNLVGIVPFGLPANPPVKHGIGPKKLFNLKESDKIVLWGGGIWDWFDPLTLIRAIHQISRTRSDIHLVFMGLTMPSETGCMSMPERAYQLAKELDLLDKYVFFNKIWIPYEQRTAFLLESDIGISTHFDHLETRYSFRTRLLDYIWAGLPIINTEGDSFSRLIAERRIGLTVPYENVKALSEAILYLIDAPGIARDMKENLKAVCKEFHWDKVTEPLERMLAEPWKKTSKAAAFKQVLGSIYHAKGPFFPFKIAASRIFK
jgi:glycosyltransferase involved in cell wall biosynthesis